MEKRNSIYGKKSVVTKSSSNVNDMNIIQKEIFKTNHSTTSENGATKLTTTGNIFVDDFGSIGKFKSPRAIDEIFETMTNLWNEDKLLALKEMSYIRLITRDIKMPDGTIIKGQKGQGLKAEYIGRLYWLALYASATFEKNFDTFVSIGCWNDFIELLRTDLYYHEKLNNNLWKVVISHITDTKREDIDLIKKYLPNIKPSSKCKTVRNEANNYIAKRIAKALNPTISDNKIAYKEYRKFKSSGKAHEWQKLISRGEFDALDFSKIGGRALNELANNKFLEKHQLTKKFADWLYSQTSVKYTGFPYELFSSLKSDNKIKGITASKQFETLVEKGKSNAETNSNFLVCVDTSGSMSQIVDKGISAIDVAYSMALYFSYFIEGKFSGTYLEFADNIELREWKGTTPYERVHQTRLTESYGSTNFLGVAHKLVELLKHGYSESDFPSGVLCVSDGEFNCGWSNPQLTSTSFDEFKHILRNGGFTEDFVNNFKLVLWDVPRGQSAKFEGIANAENFFYMSGFDPSGVTFLCGGEVKDENGKVVTVTPKNAEELFEVAMNQDVLNLLKV